MARLLALWILAASVAAAVACGRAERGESASANAPAAAAPEADRSESTSGAGASELPAPGTGIVWPSPRGVTVIANEVPREGLLRDLALQRRFALEIRPGTSLPGTVTVRAEDASLDEVLPVVLEGVPYTVRYGVEESTRARVLTRLVVGDAAATKLAEAPKKSRARPKRELARPDASWEREELERRNDRYLDGIESEDAEVRASSASFVQADRDTIPVLADLLADDPDPRVRAAAAATLGEADDSSAAVRALVSALNDPDPEVVVAAIDGLEWVDDPRVIPDLQPLLQHPASEVRERTVEAMEWLAD